MPKLLIDGDVYLYKACCAKEVATEWEGGFWTYHADFDETRGLLEDLIQELLDELDATEFVFALSDRSGNWRKTLEPTYKNNRKGKKPLVYRALSEWCEENLNTVLLHHAEGDDVLGILATMPGAEDVIIVSIDKDMQTLPTRIFNPDNA